MTKAEDKGTQKERECEGEGGAHVGWENEGGPTTKTLSWLGQLVLKAVCSDHRLGPWRQN